MARLTEYNFEICLEICERVSMGEHVYTVVESDPKRYPTFPTWCRWKREHDELFKVYTRAIQDKAEMVVFEINQAMNDLRNGTIDAAQARVIIDTYKWMAAKFYPKMFGDKLDLTTDGEKINTVDPFLQIRQNVGINNQTEAGDKLSNG